MAVMLGPSICGHLMSLLRSGMVEIQLQEKREI